MNNWMLKDDEKLAIDVSGKKKRLGKCRGETQGGLKVRCKRRDESLNPAADRKRKKAKATQRWRERMSPNEKAVRRQLEKQSWNRYSLQLIPIRRPGVSESQDCQGHHGLLQGMVSIT